MLSPATIEALERLALALVVALAGGAAFHLAGLPAPWLSGPGAGVALAAVAGWRVGVPAWLRWVTLVFLGATMGAAVTPETLSTMARWPLSLVGLAVAVMAVMNLVALYLERVHGYDRATARLSAVPGALPFVLALAAESNADQRRVAIVQMVRLGALLVAIPALLSALGIKSEAPVRAAGIVRVGEIGVLMAAGAIGAVIAGRLRAPAAALFGSMVGGAVMFGSGAITTALPGWLLIPGFLVIGAMVGSNFAGMDRMLLAATLKASIGSVVVGALVALGCAVPVALVLGLPPAQMWMAYAPGGVDVMAVMAMALGFDPAFVGGHHVARFLGLGLVVPWWLGEHLRRGGDTSAT